MHTGSPSDAQAQRACAAADGLAPVVRLRPVRTLVISPDRTYRERALAVLSELGPVAFAVMSLADPGDIAGLLALEPADVVVLDATGCEGAAARVIRALGEAAPQLGVVIVCHHCTEAARKLHALPKWGWTQDLRAGVELAYHEGNPLCDGALSPLKRRSAWQRIAGPLVRR